MFEVNFQFDLFVIMIVSFNALVIIIFVKYSSNLTQNNIKNHSSESKCGIYFSRFLKHCLCVYEYMHMAANVQCPRRRKKAEMTVYKRIMNIQ